MKDGGWRGGTVGLLVFAILDPRSSVVSFPLRQQLLQHHPHVARRALQVRLREQFTGRKTQRLLELAELLVAGRVGHAAGLDQREVRLGNARPPGQLVEREPEPTALAAKFGTERFHVFQCSGRHDESIPGRSMSAYSDDVIGSASW